MRTAQVMGQIAATDRTFTLRGGEWIGKCLICGGPLRFDAKSGEGANIEHILPRTLGGGNDLRNLGITHPRCNSEKGRNWDSGRWRSGQPERYQTLVGRLLAERMRRWRELADTPARDDDATTSRAWEATA
jgi:5-methylcytosine-specific restriction endonuclease McrA